MTSASLSSLCVPATFGTPSLFGAEILSVDASLVTNYSINALSAYTYTQPSVTVQNTTFCNITVTYTHPGEDDTVNVEAWLPVNGWNERFQAVGGGGWVAGRFLPAFAGMGAAIAGGYATVTTDAGLGNAVDASPWALLSPGNVDLYKLQDMASVSLNDEAIIAKDLIKSFYGKYPTYSYWNGCSQGGRQGLMLAQRYPTIYDGIIAGAPAIYFPEFAGSIYWPQQYMNMLGKYPYGCELDAITAAAVSACDGLDGVVDGIISNVDECMACFNPFKLIGTRINCSQTHTTVQISHAAAAISNASWNGMVSSAGESIWPGYNIGADLTGAKSFAPGIAATNCTGGVCVGEPNILGTQWLQLLVEKNPSFVYTNLSVDEFNHLIHAGQQQFTSIISTNDPDLSEFRDAGGKMLSFHGLADNTIPTKGTEQYYKAVTALLPDVYDFYRYFEIPGLSHCYGGAGGQPTAMFAQLRAWVENGTAPVTSPVSYTGLNGTVHNRILCPYPHTAQFNKKCGNATAATCWSCVATAS